jgi:hypothetical protein
MLLASVPVGSVRSRLDWASTAVVLLITTIASITMPNVFLIVILRVWICWLDYKEFEIFPGGLTITSNAAVESARCDTRYWLDFLLKTSFD